VEMMADDQNLDYDQRAALRSRLAYPILCAFEKWLVNYFPKALPKGRMSRALFYTYNLFQRLSRYHLDGRYRIDNNLQKPDNLTTFRRSKLTTSKLVLKKEYSHV